ncbi:hypothetical protein ASE39_24875 [Acidovorax sp. Root267]|uniref:hypothetical protein n=1 Tax=Acidovorax sp. Root267 TaxID=1736505 RepID=UPI0007105810|nr:hypothetical protein [Acidovorax sp. Root267]KRD21334.1 hypothetical protein ASE39_24875 [Acidovorax sp. Root267]
MPSSYRSVDHVMLRLDAVEPLFRHFSETFGLPVAWPLQRTDFATYGWVYAGNTDLEFWAAASNSDLPAHAQPPLIHGFALEPAQPLSESLGWVNEAGITNKPPRTFQSENTQGELVTNFTNAVLLDLSAPSCCVFFCEWDPHAAIYPWSEAATPVHRRAQHRQALLHREGGPLGIIGLHAIRMGTPDIETLGRQWRALAGAHSGHSIALTPDISLELVPGRHLRIESLSFGVRSLAVARAFLASRLLLQADTGNELSVACEGLQIRLVEASPALPLP